MNVALGLLSQNSIEGEEPFYQVVNRWEDALTSGASVLVCNLSTQVVHEAEDNLVFKISAPQSWNRFNLEAPSLLANAAVDAACRLADSMRRRRSDITVQTIKERLKREIKALQ